MSHLGYFTVLSQSRIAFAGDTEIGRDTRVERV